MPDFTDQTTVHPSTLTKLSRGELEPARSTKSRVRIFDPREPDYQLKVRDEVWEIAKKLCDGHVERIQIISELEVMVWNNGEWRKNANRRVPDDG